MHSFLNHQKKVFDDAEELSLSLRKIFQCNVSLIDWPNVTCHLKHCKESESYADIMRIINTIVRSSSSTILCELGLDPLRKHVLEIGPEINELKKDRNMKLTGRANEWVS